MAYLLDHAAEAARDRWFGAQAAADFLSVHRSTVFLAIQRGHLRPDAYTPGGFARFRQSTLEEFSQRLAEEAATGTAPLFAPIHMLAELAHNVKDMTPEPIPTGGIPDEVRAVCASAVMAISKPPLHAPICLIALRTFDPSDPDPYSLTIAAQAGIGRSFTRDYHLL